MKKRFTKRILTLLFAFVFMFQIAIPDIALADNETNADPTAVESVITNTETDIPSDSADVTTPTEEKKDVTDTTTATEENKTETPAAPEEPEKTEVVPAELEITNESGSQPAVSEPAKVDDASVKPEAENTKPANNTEEKLLSTGEMEEIPDPSQVPGAIDNNIYPATDFSLPLSSYRMAMPALRAAGASPIIGTDHPTEPGEVMLYKVATPVVGMVNTWDVTLRMEAKDSVKTSDIVLVIDRSGSMADEGKMTAAKEAARNFVNTLLPSTTTRIAVVSYAGDFSTDQELTNDINALTNAINRLRPDGGTFTQAGIKQAQAILANSGADFKNIVLLSDGKPTYSYDITNPGNYLVNGTVTTTNIVGDGTRVYDVYGPGKITSTGVPEGAFKSNRIGGGSAMYLRYQNYSGLVNDEYYSHGNSTIAQAGFAKASSTLWTILLGNDSEGIEVLHNAATEGKDFTASPADLNNIFQNIAGSIAAAMKDAAVTDPMGNGFEIPSANVSQITTVPASPAPVYENGTIKWNPGTLTTPVAGQTDINYAELKYRIEINDAILSATPVGETYPTNGKAIVTYNGGVTGEFPVPMVNPVLYTVEAELQDPNGNVVHYNNDFTIKVTGTDYDKNYILNPENETKTRLLTSLRNATTYNFDTTGFGKYVASDFKAIKYFVNGVETDIKTFTVEDGNTEDVHVKVVYVLKAKDIEVTKVWDDENNRDGIRPANVTINLLKNGAASGVDPLVLPKDGSLTGKFENLLIKDENGKAINYTISESEVTGYETTISDDELPDEDNDKYTVTNRYVPKKTSVSVTKVWDDKDNQDGIRPQSVTVELLADGDKTGKTVVLNEGNSWKATFEDLYVNKEKAKPEDPVVQIVYTVEETDLDIELGYKVTVEGSAENGYTVTNSRTPETIEIKGAKTWNDTENQDGMRPSSITIRLLADGTEVDSKTVTEADGWSWSFEGLPKYENGEAITYTITEDKVADYTSVVSGYNVTNTHETGKTNITVTKKWNDADNQDGKRPASVEIILVADGDDTDKKLVLTEAGKWTGTFTDLDEYKAGKKIVYTVKETAIGNGYTSEITGEASTGYTVTNSRTPEKTEVSGKKTWDDTENQDGMRPATITIRLMKNGTEVDSKTVTEADGWAWNFKDLDKYENGKEINYSVTEDAVPEYKTEVNGYDVTNSHTPGKTSVMVTKSWMDADNQDGKRPESVIINLLADGEDTGKTVVLNMANSWTDTFTDLDEYKAGKKIAYTVKETEIGEGYASAVTGDAATGYTVTNSRTPEVTMVEGMKTWMDNDNQDNKRPEKITVRLLKNGKETANMTVSEAEGWKWSFKDLPKYEAGKEITYTVTEDAVAEYSAEVKGYDITNTHTPGKRSVQVTKTWLGGKAIADKRPAKVKIMLFADGEDTGKTIDLTAENNWTGTFMDLDEYKAGKKIVYTVKEEAVVNYLSAVTGDMEKGFVVSNTYVSPLYVELKATKEWKGGSDKHPTIWLKLMRNIEGEKAMPVEGAEIMKLENGTTMVSWKDLDVTDMDGNEYIYSVMEVDADGKDYVPENYKKTEKGLMVTNTYEAPKEPLPNTGEARSVLPIFGLMALAGGVFLFTKKRQVRK